MLLAFLFFIGFTVHHAFFFVRDAIYWSYHRDEPVEGWMNVGYVAHSYRVPPHVLYKALGMPHKPPDRRPLSEIAREQNRSMDDVRAVLMDAIVRARPPNPPPPPPDEGGAP